VTLANSGERNCRPKTQVPNTGTWGTLPLSTFTGITEVISSPWLYVNKFKTTEPGPPADSLLPFYPDQMNPETSDEFWQSHLANGFGALVHFVPQDDLNAGILRKASDERGFAFFATSVQHVQTASELISEVAVSMGMPRSVQGNWDALLDLARDLSWNKAPGYVLTLWNADSLLALPGNAFSVLVRVLEATVRGWRDERGEYRERTAPIPFHVIFSGGDSLRASLLKQLRETLCDHEVGGEVPVIRTTGGITEAEAFQDARRLLGSGADVELTLLFLQDRGYGHVDSIYAIAALLKKGIPEAKALVDQSQIWSTQLRDDDLKRRESARRALRDLGFL